MNAHTESAREHVANAAQILAHGHSADDVDAALARLMRALKQIDAEHAEHAKLVDAVRTMRRAVSVHFMTRGLDAIDARRRAGVA